MHLWGRYCQEEMKEISGRTDDVKGSLGSTMIGRVCVENSELVELRVYSFRKALKAKSINKFRRLFDTFSVFPYDPIRFCHD